MPEPNCQCAACGKPLYRSPRQIANSKTGLFYCCIMHRRKWRVLKKTAYRKLAFDNYPHKCDECGYDFVEILEVHHVDFDHSNDRLENLRILCPNCHRELHWFARLEGQMDSDYDPSFDDPDWED